MIRRILRVREFLNPRSQVEMVTSGRANRFQRVSLCHSNPLAFLRLERKIWIAQERKI